MPKAVIDQQAPDSEEQSLIEDHATSAGGTGVETKPAGDSAESTTETVEAEETTEAVDLIGQEKFDSLKDNPAALRKELNKAATRKFQELAAERKALKPYAAFIEKLNENPRAAITALAKQLGMEMGEARTEKEVKRVAETLDDRISEVVKRSLGPEYEDLADRLAPAIREAAKLVADEATRPATEQLEQVIQDSALRESQLALDAFSKKHSGWQEHEEAMVELSKRMTPGEGMTEAEYLENLYFLVTREAAEGEGVKKVVKKMVKAAQGGGEGTTVSGSHVTRSPNRPPTFAEAAEAARRGERLE